MSSYRIDKSLLDRITPNFTWGEAACRDTTRSLPPKDLLSDVVKMAAMMEEIRRRFGSYPVTVNSWYRTPAYNVQVGGSPKSMHTKGIAVDFTISGMTPRAVQKKLLQWRGDETLRIGGIGQYRSFTHVDLGPKRTWRG